MEQLRQEMQQMFQQFRDELQGTHPPRRQHRRHRNQSTEGHNTVTVRSGVSYAVRAKVTYRELTLFRVSVAPVPGEYK
jgi:hypothetical protein